MTNFLQAIKNFLSYPTHTRILSLFAFLVILTAIPLTVFIAQQQQEIRQRAEGNCSEICDGPPTCKEGAQVCKPICRSCASEHADDPGCDGDPNHPDVCDGLPNCQPGPTVCDGPPTCRQVCPTPTPLPAQVCTPNEWSSNKCAKCKPDGSEWNNDGSDFGTGSTEQWCICAQKYKPNNPNFQALCATPTTQPTPTPTTLPANLPTPTPTRAVGGGNGARTICGVNCLSATGDSLSNCTGNTFLSVTDLGGGRCLASCTSCGDKVGNPQDRCSCANRPTATPRPTQPVSGGPGSGGPTATPTPIQSGPTPTGTRIAGDIDGDGHVTIQDYSRLASCYGTNANTPSCGTNKAKADLNNDGKVDGIDYNILIRNFGR